MLSFLAVVCPPAAVLILKPSRVPVNLLLTLLLFVPGVVHALHVVEECRTRRRNAMLMRLVSRYESAPGLARRSAEQSAR